MHLDGKLFFMIETTSPGLDFGERKLPPEQQREILDRRLADVAAHGFNLLEHHDMFLSADYREYKDIPAIYDTTAGWGPKERVALMKTDAISFSEYLVLRRSTSSTSRGGSLR